MYNQYWGFIKKPFDNTVDPGFFYYSPEHREALSRMLYTVSEKKTGFLLAGEYGTGKTLLSRALIRECPQDKFRFAVICNPRLTAVEFIKEINYQLSKDSKLSASSEKLELLHSASAILEDNYRRGLHSVVLVDEAQSIEEESLLEELRLLLNIQKEESILFSLILLGQPPLAEKIDRIPQLGQRLSLRYKLHPLSRQDSQEYIHHRLRVAGLGREIFSQGSYDEIYSLSRGIPREINNLCDLALIAGFINQSEEIDKDIIDQVAKDLENNYSKNK